MINKISNPYLSIDECSICGERFSGEASRWWKLCLGGQPHTAQEAKRVAFYAKYPGAAEDAFEREQEYQSGKRCKECGQLKDSGGVR